MDARARYGRVEFAGSALRLWCYSEEEISTEQSPWISLTDANGHGTPAIPLFSGRNALPTGKWVQVEIPFNAFVGIVKDTRAYTFDPQKLEHLTIFQGLDDDKPHTVCIDEIIIGDAASSTAKAPTAPTGLAAKAYDRHIDLTWAPVQDAELQFYKIYRSRDGKAFIPLYLWPHSVVTGRTSRIFWREATSPRATNDELLTMVQEACFRYYWEAAHPNEGMASEILPGDDENTEAGRIISGHGIWRSSVRYRPNYNVFSASQMLSSMMRMAQSACS